MAVTRCSFQVTGNVVTAVGTSDKKRKRVSLHRESQNRKERSWKTTSRRKAERSAIVVARTNTKLTTVLTKKRSVPSVWTHSKSLSRRNQDRDQKVNKPAHRGFYSLRASEVDFEEVEICNIKAASSLPPILCKVIIEDHILAMELDTGAAVSAISDRQRK